MFSAGLFVLLLACALLLSSLQGWALRGRAHTSRHLLVWLAGTAAVSLVLAAGWGVAMSSRLGTPLMPVPRSAAILLLDVVVAIGVGAALGAGVLHTRRVGATTRRRLREAWLARAMVQGVTLAIVGGIGTATIVALAVARSVAQAR